MSTKSDVNEGNIIHHGVNENPIIQTISTIPTLETTGHELGSVAGQESIGNPYNPNLTMQSSTRQHMKFKDCGVRRNKIVFVCPQDLEKYNNDLIGLSFVLNQTITVVPNQHRNCHDYQVVWAAKRSLSVSFDNDHFCTKDNDDIQAIHLA